MHRHFVNGTLPTILCASLLFGTLHEVVEAVNARRCTRLEAKTEGVATTDEPSTAGAATPCDEQRAAGQLQVERRRLAGGLPKATGSSGCEMTKDYQTLPKTTEFEI